MSEITSCKFCSKEIPTRSIFCPYCGKQVKVPKSSPKKPKKLGDKISEGIQKSVKGVRNQLNIFLSNLQENVTQSQSLSFVNKQKIVNVLQQLQGSESTETQPSSEEISEWAKSVEEAISGDKCIICLQKFELKEGEKLEVNVCPSCNYAGHPKHFDTWLETRSSCPMCREEVTKKTVIHAILSLKGEELVFSNAYRYSTFTFAFELLCSLFHSSDY